MSKPSSSRILSRKLVFLYYYARLFNESILNQTEETNVAIQSPQIHEDLTELTDWLGVSTQDLAPEENTTTPIDPIVMNDDTIDDDIAFIAQHQLSLHSNNKTLQYDIDFVAQLCTGYSIYRPIIGTITAPHTDKFGYDDMSLTRRAILLLGYTEHKTLNTPTTVIMNECVELAKSYEDAAAAKLINGIMHQLFDIEESTAKDDVTIEGDTNIIVS